MSLTTEPRHPATKSLIYHTFFQITALQNRDGQEFVIGAPNTAILEKLKTEMRALAEGRTLRASVLEFRVLASLTLSRILRLGRPKPAALAGETGTGRRPA